jgi:SAM-dependent methyltransferase
MSDRTSRWSVTSGVQRGPDYDEKWRRLAAAGESIHGEADFVSRLAPRAVLDAGCGTGRVAIELAARGVDVVGVDLDEAMLATARAKAPGLDWVCADVCSLDLRREFDVVVAAGNVMIFLHPGSESTAVASLAAHLAVGGALVAGFQLGRAYDLDDYDLDCAASGLELEQRFATWDGAPWSPGGDYAVSVHRSVSTPGRRDGARTVVP